MTKTAKNRKEELLDELLKDCKNPEDITGENGLLKQLVKGLSWSSGKMGRIPSAMVLVWLLRPQTPMCSSICQILTAVWVICWNRATTDGEFCWYKLSLISGFNTWAKDLPCTTHVRAVADLAVARAVASARVNSVAVDRNPLQ